MASENTSAPTRQAKLHQPAPVISPNIFILGAKSVGHHIAQSLASLRDTLPINILSQEGTFVRQLHNDQDLINMSDSTAVGRLGLDKKHTLATISDMEGLKSGIEKLIVTTNARSTVSALLTIKDRLLPSSTICFVQNEMGIIDQVSAEVFPNPALRPRYMIGFSSLPPLDQLRKTSSAASKKISGSIWFSLLPISIAPPKENAETFHTLEKPLIQRMSYGWTASSRDLMRSLTQCQDLSGRGLPYQKLHHLQLERLAVDAVLGPLSVIFNCGNESLLNIPEVTELTRNILEEIALVIESLPELRPAEVVKDRYSPQRLISLVVGRARRTSNSINPMLKDIRKGKRTDIDFINGYFVKRGLELGLSCPINQALITMIKAKQIMGRRRKEALISF